MSAWSLKCHFHVRAHVHVSIVSSGSDRGHSVRFVRTFLPRRLGRRPRPQQCLGLALELPKGERDGCSSGFQARITNSAAVNVLVDTDR